MDSHRLMLRLQPLQAFRYFLKAIQLGAPWVVYCPSREALRALYVGEGVGSEFSVAWSKHQAWADDAIESNEMKRRRLEQAFGK